MQDRPTILVPVRVLEKASIPEGVPELLANAHVVLLGYHVVPDQTATNQARMQFEDRATERLDQLEAHLAEGGATVERRLVFTHEGQQTIHRTIREHDCLAVLVPDTTRQLENVLVAIRGTVGLDRIVRVVAGLFADDGVGVTLYHVAGEDETDEDAETLLEGVATRLSEEGLDPGAIDHRVARDEDPLDAIVDISDEFEAIVMGESDPTLATFLFGMRAEQVADRFVGPVLVVQREPPEDVDEEDEDEPDDAGNGLEEDGNDAGERVEEDGDDTSEGLEDDEDQDSEEVDLTGEEVEQADEGAGDRD